MKWATFIGALVLGACECAQLADLIYRCEADGSCFDGFVCDRATNHCVEGGAAGGASGGVAGGAPAGGGAAGGGAAGGVDAGMRCPTSCTSTCCEDGTTPARAAKSCRAILLIGDGGLTSRPYWIDPDFDGPRVAVPLYCDMDGGWTLVGKVDGTFDVYDRWLRADVDVPSLSSPAIDAGYACIDAVWMAVNSASEVRLSSSDLSRWTRWSMIINRTVETWWRHDAGLTAVVASPHIGVNVFLSGGTSAFCYQNVYGLNPGGSHGGGYPSAYAPQFTDGGGAWGWSFPGDLCMSVATQVIGVVFVDGFQHNGNGQDAPTSDLDWPNASINQPPHVSVWLR